MINASFSPYLHSKARFAGNKSDPAQPADPPLRSVEEERDDLLGHLAALAQHGIGAVLSPTQAARDAEREAALAELDASEHGAARLPFAHHEPPKHHSDEPVPVAPPLPPSRFTNSIVTEDTPAVPVVNP